MKSWTLVNLKALLEHLPYCTLITLPHQPLKLRGRPHELRVWSTAHLDFSKVDRGIVEPEVKKEEHELSNQAVLLLQAHGSFKELKRIVNQATLDQERNWQCDDSQGSCVWQSYAQR
ncbi:hypothetical protein KW782_04920 [Candidatus Parcubacteria bacterium]|nr:hypothetical protein [Candidatus Parcubacteria bacterium]